MLRKERNEFGTVIFYPFIDSENDLREHPFSGCIRLIGDKIYVGNWELDMPLAKKLVFALQAAVSELENEDLANE